MDDPTRGYLRPDLGEEADREEAEVDENVEVDVVVSR